MHSDIERELGYNARQSWSVNGLDLLFPDVGPIETSDLPPQCFRKFPTVAYLFNGVLIGLNAICGR